MLTEEELEERLKNVDRRLCVVFAARCSLRVLPLLIDDTAKAHFSYWDKQRRGNYLLSILTAQRYAINVRSAAADAYEDDDEYAYGNAYDYAYADDEDEATAEAYAEAYDNAYAYANANAYANAYAYAGESDAYADVVYSAAHAAYAANATDAAADAAYAVYAAYSAHTTAYTTAHTTAHTSTYATAHSTAYAAAYAAVYDDTYDDAYDDAYDTYVTHDGYAHAHADAYARAAHDDYAGAHDIAHTAAHTYATSCAHTAAHVAASAAAEVKVFDAVITLDLDNVVSSMPFSKRLMGQKNTLSAETLASSPLWLEDIPADWQRFYQRWKQAVLDLDEGFEHWVEWYEDRIKGVPLNPTIEQKWFSIPPEIKKQGAKASNAYFASLFSATLSPINLVRAIFIGDGAVGKTSLIRRLHGEPILEGKEVMTPGIEIKQWSLPDSEIKARFWDFGGQVMSHSMHQFFLRERCLYILLVDAGSEREKREHTTANDRAEYWLEHIQAFGNAAPVMLVGNKADKESVNLDMNALKEKYPNIIDFYPVSCTSTAQNYRARFQVFQDDLIEHLKQVDTHQVMFTDKQFTMLQNLRERSRKSAFLDHEAFDTLCLEHEIGKVGLDKTAFLGLLDSLGEIVHFPELEWSEAYVLNPRWLTYGVYTLLYAPKTDVQLGLLSNADVIEILQAEKVEDELGNVLTYPKAKCRFIVDAMSRFGLCYEMVDKTQGKEKRLVIPDKLPKNQPDLQDYFKETEGTLAFEFDFDGLLPRSLMPNLIVSRHKEILETKQGEQLVWQQGVILHNPTYKAKARLQVDYIQRRLHLWVQGDGLREYLAVLRDEVHRLLSPIKGLTFTQNIVLPTFARVDQHMMISILKEQREKAPYNRLVKEAARGLAVTSSDSGVDYDLKKVMGFIMTEEQQKKANAAAGIVNIFQATAHIAAQSSGDHNKVSGKITIGAENQQAIGDLKQSLTDLMKHVQNHDADFEIKANAYAELKQIREHLDALETASPETRGKLFQLLSSVKDGSLGAIKLGQEIKDASETLTWLMAAATTVNAFLGTLPI